jgi:ribonuclease H2 subunit A
MVYGIAFCPISQLKLLKDLGCADSKQLNENEREKIFVNANQNEDSVENIGWAVDIISPTEISTSMYRRVKRSLNEVSMESAIALVKKAIELGVNVAELYVDTVGPPEKYQAKLKAIFPGVKVTVAKKADSTYPIVSLASICAKVSRDHVLHTWKFREEVEVPEKGYGSGYPGDEVTKKFLRDNIDKVFGFPRIVRFSWSTAENLLEEYAYPMHFEEEDDEKEKPTFSGKKMTSFFKADSQPTKKFKRNNFWKDRCLEDVTDF